jgi:hypothetical protein
MYNENALVRALLSRGRMKTADECISKATAKPGGFCLVIPAPVPRCKVSAFPAHFAARMEPSSRISARHPAIASQ